MNPRIFVLAFASFAVGTETYVFSGLLARLAADLGVSVATAGQLSSVFAIVYALSAPVAASLVARMNRRRVLVVALALLGGLNVVAGAMPTFGWLLAVRVACGLAATLVTPVAAAAAATLVPPEARGRALAVVLAGITLSFVLGIPLGSVVGDFFGWRATFTFSGILAFGAAAAIGRVLPPVPSGDRAGLATLAVAFERPVAIHLLLTMSAFLATFCVVAFIGPVVTRISGLEGAGIGLMQACIGFGSIIGVLVGGRVADRRGSDRAVTAGFVVIGLTLALYTVWMHGAVGISGLAREIALALTLLAGAAALLSLSPVIQTRLVEAAPRTRNVVLALNGSMIFLGQRLGAALGGAVITVAGLPFVGVAGPAVAALGAALALAGPHRRVAIPRAAE